MISGIYLTLYPSGRDADAMHAILDDFVSDHEGLRDIDETTRRELTAVEEQSFRAGAAACDNQWGRG
jgi:hypothetical protein